MYTYSDWKVSLSEGVVTSYFSVLFCLFVSVAWVVVVMIVVVCVLGVWLGGEGRFYFLPAV